MSDDCAKVPSFIPGKVIDLIEVGICQDGARYLFAPLGPHIAHLRVKPLNDVADKALLAAYKSREDVVIGGYPCTGVEPGCKRFDCFVVHPAGTFAEKAANL